MKKIPLRRCLATGEMLPKEKLFRIVKTCDGEIILDLTGKINGRGAYVSKTIEAIEILEKRKLLNKAFETNVDDKVYETLRKAMNE